MPFERVDVTFRLSAEDYLALGRHVPRVLIERLVATIYWVGVGTIGAGVGLALYRWFWLDALGFEGSDTERRVFVIGCAIAVGVLFFEVVMKRYARTVIAASQHIGEASLTADAHGFSERCGAMVFSAPWSSIERVHDTPKHLFFFLKRRQGVVVPRTALSKEAEEVLLGWARATAPRLP